MAHAWTIKESRITNWFHTPDPDGITPAISVRDVMDAFLESCFATELRLWLPVEKLRRMMCEFTCTLYIARKYRQYVEGPRSRQRLPPKWTEEMYESWIDFLQHAYFSDTHWEYIWSKVQVSDVLQQAVPDWRSEMQAILPYFILCDQERMVEEGILCEAEDGQVVFAEEYDSSQDDHWD